jgi:hypothetical protein
MASSTPTWPSLYNPGLEILHIQHHNATQPGASYIYNSFGTSSPHILGGSLVPMPHTDVFRFTLYWNLIFYTPIFLCCGTYAFLNITFPPSRPASNAYPLTPMSIYPIKPLRKNERRSRITFAVLVLLVFLTLSVGGAVLGSAVVGFILVGVFRVAKYNMST